MLVIDSIFDKQEYTELGTHEFCVTLANDPSYRCLFFEYLSEELKTRDMEVFRVVEKDKTKDAAGGEKEQSDDDFFGAGSENAVENANAAGNSLSRARNFEMLLNAFFIGLDSVEKSWDMWTAKHLISVA